MEDKDSKTFDPTQKKLDDAKKKGQTGRSKELSNFSTLLAASVLLMACTHWLGMDYREWFSSAFKFESVLLESPEDYQNFVVGLVIPAIGFVAVLLFVLLGFSMLGNLAVGGWVFAPMNALPKIDKINPIKGIMRILSVKTLVELIKSILKLLICGLIAYLYIKVHKEGILEFSLLPALVIGQRVADEVTWFFMLVSSGLLLLVAIDVPFQIYEYKKGLKMSRQDLKDENKQTEGDPEVKGRIKQMQRERAMGRMMADAASGDVVIVNPQHYSVVLRYKENEEGVPVVLASGVGEIALKLREIAKENDIVIVESPPLARSLYRYVKVGDAIPNELFRAVATVINFVLQLDRMTAKEKMVNRRIVKAIKVPEEFKYEGELGGLEQN